MSKGVNSSAPTTAEIIGGVYNATPPVLQDGQASAIQLDINGQVKTTGGGGSGGNVNITGVNGSAPALTNPLPVELSDGSAAVGTAGNPLGVKDSSDGSTGASVPSIAIQAGARAATAYPTAVTDGQMVGVMADKAGRLATVLNAPRDLVGTASLSSSSGTAVSFIGAGAANVFNDITTLVITNESSTATIVTLSDNGSGGNTYKFAIAANGGIVINFPTPLPQGTSAAAWDVLNSAAVALDYFAIFVKNK